MEFTHFDEKGASRLVDVTDKNVTRRVAVATGKVKMKKETLQAIHNMKINLMILMNRWIKI